jgi:prepilin-type N-terminal cleavage/methylation domain-containing protein
MIAKKTSNRGFTLLETLVAVMILATAVAGPLSIASRALNNSLVAKDQITAFYLAQDGLEYVRFARDSNSLKGADWLAGTGGTSAGIDLTPCASAAGCYVDSTMAVVGFGDVPTACDSGLGCPALYYDNDNSRYTYNSGGTNVSQTVFTRQIVLNSISATEQQLTVSVLWLDVGNVLRRVNLYENIFKWQQ